MNNMVYSSLNEGMSITFPSSSKHISITSLSELFVEWFLYSEKHTVKEFLKSQNLSKFISESDFHNIITEKVFLGDDLSMYIFLTNPFHIKLEKLRRFNTKSKNSLPCLLEPDRQLLQKAISKASRNKLRARLDRKNANRRNNYAKMPESKKRAIYDIKNQKRNTKYKTDPEFREHENKRQRVGAISEDFRQRKNAKNRIYQANLRMKRTPEEKKELVKKQRLRRADKRLKIQIINLLNIMTELQKYKNEKTV